MSEKATKTTRVKTSPVAVEPADQSAPASNEREATPKGFVRLPYCYVPTQSVRVLA